MLALKVQEKVREIKGPKQRSWGNPFSAAPYYWKSKSALLFFLRSYPHNVLLTRIEGPGINYI